MPFSSFPINNGGAGNVNSSATLTSGEIVRGDGSTDVKTNGDITANSPITTNNNLTINNGLIGERILFDETWPGGNNTLNGSMGTWTESVSALINNFLASPPDGGNSHRRSNAGGNEWILTSPLLDLTRYHLLEEGDDVLDDETFTRTRIFVKGWILAQSLDDGTMEEVHIDVFDGTEWNEVYAHRSNEEGPASNAKWVKFSCDISSYINESSDTQIRVRVSGSLGGSDRWGVGRVFIHESDVPAQMGNCFFGRTGTGFGNKAPEAPLHTTGRVIFDNLPTSDPLLAGELWSNSGVITLSAG